MHPPPRHLGSYDLQLPSAPFPVTGYVSVGSVTTCINLCRTSTSFYHSGFFPLNQPMSTPEPSGNVSSRSAKRHTSSTRRHVAISFYHFPTTSFSFTTQGVCPTAPERFSLNHHQRGMAHCGAPRTLPSINHHGINCPCTIVTSAHGGQGGT